MQKKFVLGIAALTVGASVGLTTASQAAPDAPAVTAKKIVVPVVAGATSLSAVEKGAVNGLGDCPPPPPPCPPPAPVDAKPGYGFGTTGHYGPPGQGFTPGNSWRVVAGNSTLTPKGKALPPRAFK